MNDIIKNKTKMINAIFWVIIGVFVFVPVLLCGNYPGMYLDAVNPDYAAVQILFPQKFDEMWMYSWPYLAQAYHGNIGVLFSTILIAITQNTSVLQHHMQNGFYCFIIFVLIYRILRLMQVKEVVTKVIILLGASGISFLQLCFTQYYIQLPGCIFSLIAVYIFLRDKENLSHCSLIAGSVFLGLAFYTYFNFLFLCLPIFALILWRIKAQRKNNLFICESLMCLYSFLIGAGFYIVGYTQVYFEKWVQLELIDAYQKNTYVYIFLIVYYLTLIVRVWLCVYSDRMYVYIDAILNFLFFIFWAIKVLPIVAESISGLNVSGASATLIERISFILTYFEQILSGRKAEIFIYGHITSILSGLNLFLLLVLLFSVILYIYRKKAYNAKTQSFFYVLILMGAYFCCCLFFASRMQAQHMVPMLVATLILSALGLSILTENKNKKFVGLFCGVIILVVGGINLCNQRNFVSEIQDSGGIKLYSSQINQIAYEAGERSKTDKEMYVFVDWGFSFGFNYLTKNQVAYTSIDDLEWWNYLINNEGYNLVICYWDEKDTDTYVNKLKQCNVTEERIILEERKEKDGSIAFYVLHAKTGI